MEEQLIIEIWETFKDYIPEKTREIAANHFVDFLQSKDIEIEVFEGLLGYDAHLDDAVNLILNEYQASEEDEFDEEDYDYDEDED